MVFVAVVTHEIIFFFPVCLQSAIHFYSPKTEKDGVDLNSVAANRLMTYCLNPAVNISTQLSFIDLIIVIFFFYSSSTQCFEIGIT